MEAAETKGGLERAGVSSVADILAQNVHEPELPTRYSCQLVVENWSILAFTL